MSLHFRYFSCTVGILLLLFPSGLTGPAQPNWIKPYIIDYNNGTILRDTTSSPSTPVPPPNNHLVHSQDITLSPTSSLQARLFLPTRPEKARKIPILLYFHGGAFCIGSPFSKLDTRFLSRLAARAHVLVLSVDYRLYPDATIPAPFDDAWAALNWVAAHRPGGTGSHPWLDRYGDFDRVYTGGDSAGGTIAHNLAIRAGISPLPNKVKLTGLILAMPYFLGSNRVESEPLGISESPNYKIWAYVCPNCKGGVDDGYINPFGPGAPKIADLGCEKLLVYTAGLDELEGRGKLYYEKVKKSGWLGQAQWIEARNETHVFHILDPEDRATKRLIHDFSSFLNA